MDDQQSPTQQYGVAVLNRPTNNLLSCNLVDSNGSASSALLVSANAAPGTFVIPYRTVSATVGSQVTRIPHGLSYSPLAITITMTSSGSVWSAQPADSRYIYLQ